MYLSFFQSNAGRIYKTFTILKYRDVRNTKVVVAKDEDVFAGYSLFEEFTARMYVRSIIQQKLEKVSCMMANEDHEILEQLVETLCDRRAIVDLEEMVLAARSIISRY